MSVYTQAVFIAMKFHFANPQDLTPRNGWWRLNYINKRAWNEFVLVMQGTDISWPNLEIIDGVKQPRRKLK